MQKSIGLFFGSFNPIHNGHTGLAQYLLQKGGFDEVWLVVSPNNPLKSKSDLWSEQLRIRLAKLATRDIKGLRVSDIETTLPLPSYTINTLNALSLKYPDYKFTLLMGSDNMALFDKWKQWEDILGNYPIMVYPRQGDDLESLKKKYPQMQVADGAPLILVSSTQIRKMLQNGEDIRDYVAASVAAELQKKKNNYDRRF